MFYSKRTIENPIFKKKESVLSLPNHEKKKIPIFMDNHNNKLQENVSLKHHSSTEFNAISVLMNHGIKKAIGVDTSLFKTKQLTLLQNKNLKSNDLDEIILSSLYVDFIPQENNSDYLYLVSQLPYAKPLPVSFMATPIIEQDQQSVQTDVPALSSLYSRDEDQSTLMTVTPRISTTVSMVHLTENTNKELTEETWGAIFHPQSTFKHNKGELEYVAWNSTNLPVAAARVAQRVMCLGVNGSDTNPLVISSEEPTLPTIAPSPLLKPSPGLTISTEQSTTPIEEPKEQHYFNMLKKIRGDQSCHSSILSQKSKYQLTGLKKFLLPAISTKRYNQEKTDYSIEYGTPNTSQAMIMDPEILYDETSRFWTEKKLFWCGFVCPLLWFYGSYCSKSSNYSIDLSWQRRCRIASIYFSAVLSIAVLITVVKAAGSAGVRQTQSDTIRQVISD